MGEVKSIDILLATYNGERYLAAQIDSILNQTYRDWCLIVRDDGSTDATCTILQQYARDNRDRVRILNDTAGHLGALGSFARLLDVSDAEYVMFCDQDDMWLPDKVQSLLDAMVDAEMKHGRKVPALVHSDLTVVDADLRLIHPSFVRYQWLDPDTNGSLNRLLIQNVVTGCASIINKPLKEIGVPVPAEAAMHDWWFALVAAAFGVSQWLPGSKTLYRQHGGNTLGARRRGVASILRLFVESPVSTYRSYRSKAYRAYGQSQQQAATFLRRYEARLSPAQRDLVRCYASLATNGFVKRRYYVCKFGFLTGSVVRDLATIAFV